MNKVIIVGRVAYPPRYNETDYGAVLNLMVTTTHRYKNNNGEIVERSQTNKAALWGKLAELNRDVERGELVALEGRLQNKKVQDKEGVERWETEVVANAFESLDRAASAPVAAQPQERPPQQRGTQSVNTQANYADEFTDDEIPF